MSCFTNTSVYAQELAHNVNVIDHLLNPEQQLPNHSNSNWAQQACQVSPHVKGAPISAVHGISRILRVVSSKSVNCVCLV